MREYRRLTQDQLAVLLGKSKGNVSQLEKAPFATTRIIDEWAKVLNFSIEIKAEPNRIEKPFPDNFL
jgi:transcriptional regulator with XRE-family HTH domain